MPINLPELRAQRDLVKRHLDWLEARIAEAAGESGSATSPLDAAAPSPALGNSEPTAPDAPAASPEAGGEPATELNESAADAMLASYADDRQGLSSGAKYGCIFAAALFVLLFLGLLFLLPKYLYGDKSDQNAPAAPAGQYPEGEMN